MKKHCQFEQDMNVQFALIFVLLFEYILRRLTLLNVRIYYRIYFQTGSIHHNQVAKFIQDMKNYVFAIFVLILHSASASAQYMDIYLINESVEKVTSNSERIASDALVIDSYFNLPGGSDVVDRPDGEDPEREPDVRFRFPGNFGLGVETVLTPTSKFLRLPLSYRIRDLTLSVSIPYYYQRSVKYSHGRETAAGFGDLQLNAHYGIFGSFFYTRFTANLKLPTGNANKQANGYLVPLGSGSTDVMIGNLFLTDFGPFHVSNILSYRISGSHSRNVEIFYPFSGITEQIEYNVSNGNTLLLNTMLSYPIGLGLSANGGWSLVANSKGSMDRYYRYDGDRPDRAEKNLSAHQDFLFFDLGAGLSYRFFSTDINLNLIQPVVTRRNETSGEGSRGLMFLLRISRRIL